MGFADTYSIMKTHTPNTTTKSLAAAALAFIFMSMTVAVAGAQEQPTYTVIETVSGCATSGGTPEMVNGGSHNVTFDATVPAGPLAVTIVTADTTREQLDADTLAWQSDGGAGVQTSERVSVNLGGGVAVSNDLPSPPANVSGYQTHTSVTASSDFTTAMVTHLHANNYDSVYVQSITVCWERSVEVPVPCPVVEPDTDPADVPKGCPVPVLETTVPPTTAPPVTEPPVTVPPVTEPPVTEPPTTQPPVTEPPATVPPTTAPPTTQPPVTTPEPKEEEPLDPVRFCFEELVLTEEGCVRADLADTGAGWTYSLTGMGLSLITLGGAMVRLGRKD